MNTPQITNKQLLNLLSTYWQWRWLWVSTTAVFAALGLFYVLFLKSDTWVSSQGLIVRDEANGAVMRLGRFQSQTEMKAAQETILEMARNPQVLHQALKTVGRPKGWFGWMTNEKPPSSAEVDDLAKNGIEVRAPRGAELGTTEVIYLDVKQSSPTRALELNKAVCNELEKQLQQVRQARADGVISELTTATDSARRILAEATVRLQQIEADTGADLSDLRGLTDTNSGGSNNRQLLDSIKSELRAAELQQQQLEIDFSLASDSFENPNQLLLAPGKLLSDNPGLKKLREGLADASINSSYLRGKYTMAHPLVIASLETEGKIREQLRTELGVTVESLRREQAIAQERIAKLKKQQTQLQERLEKLAEIRADYGNVSSGVKARNEQLQQAERDLTQAIASRDAAVTSSLVTRLDEPLLGEHPIGPGRSTILAGATCCGLFFGLGIVFLLSPLDTNLSYGRRRHDYTGAAGRRACDALKSQEEVESASTMAASLSLSRQAEATPRSNADRSPPRPSAAPAPQPTAAVATPPSPQVVEQTTQPERKTAAASRPPQPRPSPAEQPVAKSRKASEEPLSADEQRQDSEKSLIRAQAVIAAALQCAPTTFSHEAMAAPMPQGK